MLTVHFIVIHARDHEIKLLSLEYLYCDGTKTRANRKQKRIPARGVYAKMYADGPGVENKHDDNDAHQEFEDIATVPVVSAFSFVASSIIKSVFFFCYKC